MALYKIGEGFGVDYRDEFGRRHRKFVGSEQAALIVEARLKETAAQQRRIVSNFRAAADLSPTDAIAIYLAHLAVGKTTKAHIKERLERIAGRLAVAQVAQITPRLLDAWSQARRHEVAPSTLAQEHGMVKRWTRWLQENWYIPSAPAEHLDTHQPRSTIGKALTHDEEAKALAAATERIRLRILLALDAGLRRGEILALRKNHVDTQARTLKVWSTKTRTERIIPLTQRLHRALQKATATLAPDSLLTTYGPKGVRFGSDFLRKLRPRAGVSFRFHDLRHTFATRIAAVATNPHVVRVLLGHSARTVTDLYVHPPLEELRAAILSMEKANPNAKEKTE